MGSGTLGLVLRGLRASEVEDYKSEERLRSGSSVMRVGGWVEGLGFRVSGFGFRV